MAKEVSTSAMDSQIKPTDLVRFHTALAKWYKTNGRHDLPWRNTADPYHIWLSEVMLQQTQVMTVRARFYFPFLNKFPTIEALANAEQTEVMKAWEGLGYYSRARNLHQAAKQVTHNPTFLASVAEGEPQRGRGQRRSREGGESPPSMEKLLSLPGIGRNTAHAILAFAYHQPVPILEANVKRVVARIFAMENPNEKEWWACADFLLSGQGPRKGLMNPFDYNQAMMDVGSLICTPKAPQCPLCPANSICKGKTTPERYPTKKAKKQIPTREVCIHVREDAAGRLFLERRDEKLLGGLYGFPQHPSSSPPIISIAEVKPPTGRGQRSDSEQSGERRALASQRGVSTPSVIGKVTHTYSHFKLIGEVHHERLYSKPNSADWHSREEITALPLSTLDHKVLALVDKYHNRAKKNAKPAAAHKRR